MTPEERADKLEECDHSNWDEDFKRGIVLEFHAIRSEALEEAARVAESAGEPPLPHYGPDIAAAIRNLKP